MIVICNACIVEMLALLQQRPVFVNKFFLTIKYLFTLRSTINKIIGEEDDTRCILKCILTQH